MTNLSFFRGQTDRCYRDLLAGWTRKDNGHHQDQSVKQRDFLPPFDFYQS